MSKYYMVTFVSMYVSGIHAGIQSAHAIHRVFGAVNRDMKSAAIGTEIHNWNGARERSAALEDWDAKEPTIIVKNGGSSENMHKLLASLGALSDELNLPFAAWKEPDLDNALTAIAILVPAKVFETNPKESFGALNSKEGELNSLIWGQRLAR